MRNTRKILVALVIVLAMMMSVATLFASAADQPETLYLTPNANWKQSNARFAAYFFGNGETWVSMTDADGDGVYEVKVPTDKVYPNVIFCRMNPSASANNWNNKWNQTADLTIPTSGANHYTVKEGTWDSGGGTWATYGSTCLHTNLSDEATCTTAQTCLDCGDPVVSALGHSFDSAHLCTRCGEQATFTVAGSGAHLGTEWDTGNTANDMTYADGTYTKVYTNVAAGSYEFKVVRDHGWGTAYPSANKTYTVATTGSTVTITLKGTTVNVVVEAPHVHSYFYPCDPVCQECYEVSNPDAKHDVVHVEAKAPTCYENGNVEYWYCSYCGTAWTDEAQTQLTNMMSVVLPMAHGEAKHVEAVAPTCYEDGNIEYWYCEACGQAWLDADCTLNTNLLAVVLPMAHGEAKHVEAKAASCYEEGNIEYWYCEACGQAWLDEACTLNTNLKSVILPMAHGEAKHVEAKAATCTENGNIEYWLCEACGQAWLDEACTLNTNVLAVVLPAAHTFADGKCSVCGEADPDYEAPGTPDEETEHTFTSDLVAVPEADKDVLPEGTKYVNDYFTIVGKVTIRWSESKGVYAVELDKKSNGGIEFTVTGNSTIVVSFASTGGSNLSLIGLVDANGTAIVPAEGVEEVTGTGFITVTYNVGAGTYKVVNPSTERNTRVNSVSVAPAAEVEPPHEHVFVDGKCECGETDPNYVPPHVNTLVVGDTNKIVVSGNFVNAYNLPIEWVPFVADENAFYSFVGDNGALAMIFSADGTALLCGGTGKANLEAGNYLICVGNGVVGEFNVAVTKSAWDNTLALGANKLLITDALSNDYGYYIVWAPFEVTEKANYTFTGEGILALVYDSAYAAVTGTELDVGTYYVCVAFLTPATTGVATVNVEKTAIGGGDVVEPELPALNLGDNTVTIDGSVVNLTGSAIAWLEFVVAEDGIYTVSSADLNCYIYSEMNLASAEACLCKWTGTAELTAGTYYVCVGKDGVTGEFTVKAEKLGDDVELPAVNTLVLGDNVYVLNQALKDIGYEFLYFTADKDGIYTFTGIDELIFFIWPDYPNQATVPDTAPYIWNIDPVTADLLDSVEVELTAGTYLVGFKTVTDDGSVNTPVGEYPISVTFAEKTEDPGQQPGGDEPDPEQPGGEQPGGDEPQEEPELTLFQKILKAITDFFAKIGEFFKNLFKKQ